MDSIDTGIDIDRDDVEAPLLNEESVSPSNIANLTNGTSGDCYHLLEDGVLALRRRTSRSPDNVKTVKERLDANYEHGKRKFKKAFRCFGFHESSSASLIACWGLFVVFTLVVPFISIFSVTCNSCEFEQIQLSVIIQISESSLAAISFLFLFHNVRKHGLRKLLFLDKIEHESDNVQDVFKKEINAALWLVIWILLPCFIGKVICEVWWFTQVTVKFPFIEDKIVYRVILCMVILLSWVYRMNLFLLSCVLLRIMCSVMLVRFQDYSRHFKKNPEVSVMIRKHVQIRRQLYTISHRFQLFILSSLLAITVCQFISLFIATASKSSIGLPKAGNMVCAAVQVTGFVFCLHGAAKITHRAQRVVSLASQWHALATCHADPPEADYENIIESLAIDAEGVCSKPNDSASDVESFSNIYNIDFSHETSSFRKRQAFVLYLQHSNAGILLYGFVLDRGFIYTVFSLELSMVLFILSLTIGVNS